MALVIGAVIVVVCLFWWFAQRADERAARNRVAPGNKSGDNWPPNVDQSRAGLRNDHVRTTSPATNVTAVHKTQSLEKLIDEANAAIQRFDQTNDLAIKWGELPNIERLSNRILALSPTQKQALQLQDTLPGIRARLEEESLEDKNPAVDEMRAGLQKVAYGMVGKGVSVDDKERFKQGMTEFANLDPLVQKIAKRLQTIVAQSPGILQSGIYGQFPEYSQEQVRYALYFAHELGLVYRKKKGRSYQLFPPGNAIDG